ncbi:MAG: FKBP-type peptidyl-prolyl cis-trans isomerase [Gemmatimonadetes bacterium]|nr:FKBP-type peptidyl-prolyl cis-trans isomerase [Gemmatimonadota bacterium]
MRRLLPLLAGLALTVAACTSVTDDGSHPDWSDPTKIKFYPGLNIDLAQMTKTAAGTYYQDITVGQGRTLQVGNRANFDYTLWYPDGTRLQIGANAGFRIAKDSVIPGWVDAIPGMKEGGERKLVIPPSQAYGDRNTLVFDVVLKAITDTTTTSSDTTSSPQ